MSRAPLRPFSDADVMVVVAALVLGIWRRGSLVGPLGVALVVVIARRRRAVLLATVGLCVLGGWLGGRAWDGLQPDALGRYTGVVTLAADPAPRFGALHVVVQIEGERFEEWAHGRVARRLDPLRAGQRVWIDGDRRALRPERANRVASRHVVGQVEIRLVGDLLPGNALARATNRVHELLGRSTESFHPHDAALFTGLVVGDDRRQPEAMVDAFRAGGLSHLTAVSGQNVAFVLAVAAPLLRRLSGLWRLAGTGAVLAWFVTLTRFEPSVLRAGVMAAVAAIATARGAPASGLRVLAISVGALVLVDPLLVWSIGFWLSVGATAGVVAAGPWVTDRLPGPRPLAEALGVTLGAQAGVAPISWLVFGRMPITALPANLLAVPVAGFVMLYGLPAGVLAGFAPGWVGAVVHLPSRIGTRWVAVVAQLASRLEPPAPWPAVGWLAVGAALLIAALGRGRGWLRSPHPPHRATRPPPATRTPASSRATSRRAAVWPASRPTRRRPTTPLR